MSNTTESKLSEKQFSEGIGATTSSDHLKRQRHQLAIQFFSKLPKGLVLDDGANDCAVSNELIKIGHEVLSIDLPEVIKHGKKFNGVNLIAGDAFKLPFRDNTFDYVFFSELIEHFSSPSGLVREIFRVLKPDGTMWLTTPNVASLRNRIFMLLGFHWKGSREVDGEGHIQHFDFTKLHEYITGFGFVGMEIMGCDEYPMPKFENGIFGEEELKSLIDKLVEQENPHKLKSTIIYIAKKPK